jgi:hypothetical protein
MAFLREVFDCYLSWLRKTVDFCCCANNPSSRILFRPSPPPKLRTGHRIDLAARGGRANNCFDELAPSHCLPRGSGQGIVAAQTSHVKGRPNVRFGSKADICSAQAHVRLAPESDIRSDIVKCPLWANCGYADQNPSSCGTSGASQCISFPTFRSPSAGPLRIPTGFSSIRFPLRMA